uniref:Uncharacterized protein n=1 Tax=Caenorhabditis japonica TaxID=281687 RepID=A0A8R1ISI1_CAEJA
SYNQKRYTPKRRRNDLDDMMSAGQMAVGSSGTIAMGSGTPAKKDDMDALSTLERDVVKRTQHAQQILLRQRANQNSTPRSVTPPQQAYIIQQSNGGQQQHLSGNSANNGLQHLHSVQHMPQSQIQVSHQVWEEERKMKEGKLIQPSSSTIPQNIYTSGMLISNQQPPQQQQSQSQQSQILNPYRT